jgi:protein-L-isoaspartate(D-aspartate) O-methyltransferase
MTVMTIHAPVPDYSASRATMIDSQLRPQGVNNPAVVEAIAGVARERFVAPEARPVAYSDRAVPIGNGRLMSSATVLGLLLTEITPVAGERALVVGCGTGYSATVIKALGCEVLGLEADRALASEARGHGIEVVEGPLEHGWKKRAPYDFILIDGAIEYIPDPIVAQLTPTGRLGTSLLELGVARLVVGRRAGAGFGLHSLADFGTAALPGFIKPRGFTF